MKQICGIEIRNIQMEDDQYASLYVDKDCIVWAYPDTDFTDVDNTFWNACQYLEHHGKGVVSCDVAKINEVYYSP